MSTEISNHPVMKHKITILRSCKTNSAQFRNLMKELTFYLGYETTRTLATTKKMVQTPVAQCEGAEISEKVALVPICCARYAAAASSISFTSSSVSVSTCARGGETIGLWDGKSLVHRGQCACAQYLEAAAW